MAQGIAGKVALVTGGGSGIGQATALRFAQEGARVIVADIDEVLAQATVALINEAGGEAIARQVDVSVSSAVNDLFAHAVATFGAVHFVHNNAGILQLPMPLHMIDPTFFDQIIAVNLRGVFLVMRAAIAQMLSQGGGAIVNMSSAAGLVGQPNFAAYSASKHGVVGLTKSAAAEYAAQGIRINAVHPGTVQTPMVDKLVQQLVAMGVDPQSLADSNPSPLGRPAQADEIAGLVVWLCSDEASNIIGASITSDGGQTII